ncbi:hypothetical protein SARC_11651 [Sphaeroforma arctica JP610]|uniref:Uncharacterized protein n=1 Tax=Sphaeroforma arctica JP610 TaxID=667725 RepID=A0A0L0FGC1_9EUKA|nr:hypothetical protein SARC_11651 [Sphaeroforma arctica JP610]KNC75829.1 hypothetical protein SARC_11651 [Sphaeroforma arctica JP610]|eukprot:XP_014149731.1 hypothetical protein SARC_11651 [Sphaeroforma arctica JP610]
MMMTNTDSSGNHSWFGDGLRTYIDLTGSEPITRMVRHEQGTTSDDPDTTMIATQMCLLGPISTRLQVDVVKPPPRTEPQTRTTTSTATSTKDGSTLPAMITEADHRVSLSMESICEHMFTCGVCTCVSRTVTTTVCCTFIMCVTCCSKLPSDACPNCRQPGVVLARNPISKHLLQAFEFSCTKCSERLNPITSEGHACFTPEVTSTTTVPGRLGVKGMRDFKTVSISALPDKYKTLLDKYLQPTSTQYPLHVRLGKYYALYVHEFRRLRGEPESPLIAFVRQKHRATGVAKGRVVQWIRADRLHAMRNKLLYTD